MSSVVRSEGRVETKTTVATRELSRVETGMAVRVRRLMASPEVCQRLREIGLNENSVIRLVARQASIICQVRNARLAFSEALASQILVESIDSVACA